MTLREQIEAGNQIQDAMLKMLDLIDDIEHVLTEEQRVALADLRARMRDQETNPE